MTGEAKPRRVPEANQRPHRIIKRYSNRKLYDTKDSRYVTLLDLAALIRTGQDVRVVDNLTKEDKTDVTLALILSEELKTKPRGIPLATIKALVRSRGDGHSAVQSPIERAMAGDPRNSSRATPDDPKVAQLGVRAFPDTFEQAVDARIREGLDNLAAFRDLQAEVRRLADQVHELEHRLGSGPDRKT